MKSVFQFSCREVWRRAHLLFTIGVVPVAADGRPERAALGGKTERAQIRCQSDGRRQATWQKGFIPILSSLSN